VVQLVGAVESIEVDGYERLLRIRGGSGPALWCVLLEHSEYLEPGALSSRLRVGDQVAVDLMLDLARLEALSEPAPEGLFQVDQRSPSSVAVGVVAERLPEDVCVLQLADGRGIRVDSELPVPFELGSRVRAFGELRAVLT
jgi:hypothetical protein